MKNMKKALCLLLALVMCLGMLPVSVLAAETAPETVISEPKDSQTAPEPEAEPEVKPEAEPEDEPEIKPEAEPEVKDEEPETVSKVEKTPEYATVDELNAAFEKVGEILDDGGVQAGIDALDEYLAIYNKLSPEDQEAQAEAKAQAEAYRDVLKGSLEGEPDPEIELLYDTYKTKITLNAGDGSPTGTKMNVGGTWDGWTVTAISTSSVTFGKTGQHNNNFQIPAPEDIWTGVSSNYKTVVGYQSFASNSGDLRIGQQAQCLYTGGSGTYKNVINTPSGGGGGGSDPTVPSGPYVTVVHKYYTNNALDDSFSENVEVSGYYAYATTYYKVTRNGISYTDKSYDKYLISISGNGYQGTFTLTYKRTVAEKVTLTYKDRTSIYSGPTEYNKGSTVTVIDCTNTRTDYEFKGWDTDESADEVVHEVNDTFAINQNTTLYAVWQKKETPVTDNGNGISITKTRVSINDNPNKTTAEPGDEIKWNITVTNKSNVTKTVTLTEKLARAYFTATNTNTQTVTLAPAGQNGSSQTVTATYTVKRADEGKRIVNTVAASTGVTGTKENPTATDTGTEVPDPNKVTVTWKDGYTNTPIKTEKVDKGITDDDLNELYPGDPTREGYVFDGWGGPETDGDGNITITAQWAKFTVIKTAEKDSYTVGEDVIWTIKVSHNGNSTISGLKLTDTLPGVTLTAKTPSTKNPSNFSLGKGETAIFTATLPSAAAGNYTNTVELEKDSNPLGEAEADKSVTVTDPVTPDDAPVSIKKEVDKSEVKVGDTVNYTVKITNKTDKTQTVKVNDILPDGLTLGSSIGIKGAASASGSVIGTGTVVTPDNVADILAGITNRATSFENLEVTIAAGKTVELTYSATVEKDATGTLTNKATATVDGKEYSDTATVTVTDPETPPTPTEYKVTVKYQDEAGAEIKPSEKVDTTDGGKYDVTSKKGTVIDGYDFKEVKGGEDKLKGIVTSNETEIVLVYTKKTTPTPPSGPDIPDNPTPTVPDPGTDIPDENPPLANVDDKLNTTDHFAYVIGYPDGSVRPTANITRAEAVTIFFRLLTDEYRSANWSTENSYSDVEASAWYNNAISTATKAGIFKGDTEGTARPDDPITRAEFAALAARFISDSVTDDGTGDFADTVGHWAAKEIRLAAKAGWITGVGGGKFEPDRYINRAEVMTLVNRMLDRIPDKDHMLDDMIAWPDNLKSEWYYEAVQEATNGHDYERLEGSLTETWTQMQPVRDWEALEKEWSTAESGK